MLEMYIWDFIMENLVLWVDFLTKPINLGHILEDTPLPLANSLFHESSIIACLVYIMYIYFRNPIYVVPCNYLIIGSKWACAPNLQ